MSDLFDRLAEQHQRSIRTAVDRIKTQVINEGYSKFSSTDTHWGIQHEHYEKVVAIIESDHQFTVKRIGDRQEWQVIKSATYELNQSLIRANDSTEKMNAETLPKNFKVQKSLTLSSIILAGVTVVITLASLIKQCNQDKEATATQVLLWQRLQTQGDSLRTHQMRIDSLSRAKKVGDDLVPDSNKK